MERDNPYEAPLTDTSPADVDVPSRVVSGESGPRYPTAGTLAPRVVAAIVDNILTFVPGIIAAVVIAETSQTFAMICLVVYVLGYFVFFESIFGRTPGKFATGLIVTGYDGSPCTLSQAIIRSAARIVEVNPLLFGYLPAGLCILFSREHQRIGDKFADTVVVNRESVDW